MAMKRLNMFARQRPQVGRSSGNESARWFRPLIAAVGMGLALLATAGEPGTSVAAEGTAAMREMTTDRPDATESPFTIDVGHVQIEMDVVGHVDDRSEGVRSRETRIAAANVRVGLTSRTEIGFFVDSWIRQEEAEQGGSSVVRRGFGDVVLRGKINAWGNDGGRSAGGLIVDVTLPTARDGLGTEDVQAAVLLPLSVDLGHGWGLGAMTGIDFRHDAQGSGYHGVLLTTLVLGREVTERTGVYLELTSEAGEGTHVATLNTGLTFSVHDNLQLDAGINTGISDAANDLEFFAGLSRRF
jgi:hypothetical protein